MEILLPGLVAVGLRAPGVLAPAAAGGREEWAGSGSPSRRQSSRGSDTYGDKAWSIL